VSHGDRAGLANRTLSFVAAAFLAFDGAALVAGGLWLRRPVLTIIGGALFVSSGLVVVYWRWHQRQLAEIVEARREVAADARALRDLIQRN
jgi:protein-S-isoprenylcysteine O-methyltransferase Ste14